MKDQETLQQSVVQVVPMEMSMITMECKVCIPVTVHHIGLPDSKGDLQVYNGSPKERCLGFTAQGQRLHQILMKN